MYVYMYNIYWIRARKIHVSFFFCLNTVKLSISLVTGEGELLWSLSSVPCTHNDTACGCRRQAKSV